MGYRWNDIKMSKRVLVGCEFSGVVREAFTKKTGPLLKLKGKSKLPADNKSLMKINIKDKTDKNKNRK